MTALFDGQTNTAREAWKKESLAAFRDRMLDRNSPFPCVFGVEAVSRGTLRYAFIEDADGQARNLAAALRSFTTISESLGKRTSLVCFFESWAATRSHSAYAEHFWYLLRDVSALDDAPCPQGVSAEVDDASFEYAFNGQSMFVVVNTDIHRDRRSRSFERVAITFQPRFVFQDVAAGTPKGDEARQLIRSRLGNYDAAPVTPLLGNYGDTENREWKQYYIDDGITVPELERCPVTGFSHPRLSSEEPS